MTVFRPIASCLLVALIGIGCDETIDVPNRAPSATFDSLEADGQLLDIYYWLLDLDGDDVDIELQICEGAVCFEPTAFPGGDGLANLPTDPQEPVLHLFRWAAGCDLSENELDAEWVIRLVPFDEDVGQPIQSDSFVPNELGVVPGCAFNQ